MVERNGFILARASFSQDLKKIIKKDEVIYC